MEKKKEPSFSETRRISKSLHHMYLCGKGLYVVSCLLQQAEKIHGFDPGTRQRSLSAWLWFFLLATDFGLAEARCIAWNRTFQSTAQLHTCFAPVAAAVATSAARLIFRLRRRREVEGKEEEGLWRLLILTRAWRKLKVNMDLTAIQQNSSSNTNNTNNNTTTTTTAPSRYEAQKRRDWNTFGQYLKNHRPPLTLSRCTGTHVLEFLGYLDQFGKTKVHVQICPFFGHPNPPAPCPCPLCQAWGSLDALIGCLREAFEEHGGRPEVNPFGARAVRLYLREVRMMQAKARGIAYEKKKRKNQLLQPPPPAQQPPPPPPPPQTHQDSQWSLAHPLQTYENTTIK